MPAANSQPELHCPDDGHTMKTNDGDVLLVATCRHCDGLWFTRDAIEMGVKPVMPDTIKMTRKSVPRSQRRMCPQCGTTLLNTTVDDVSIDVCKTCGGVWLGPGSYQAARRRTTRLRVEQITNPQPPKPVRSSQPVNVFEQVVNVIGDWFVEDPEPEPPPKRSLLSFLRFGKR